MMAQQATPTGRDNARYSWGRSTVADRAVRGRADLRHRRVVIQLDRPSPHYVGVVVALGDDTRPVLLLNPQHTWADAPEVRSQLLAFAVGHYAAVRRPQ